MKEYEDIFIKNLPTIDLHGFDRESARVRVHDFVNEAMIMGYDKVVIIHGIGDGIVKRSVHEELSRDKRVMKYYVYGSNVGCTIVILRER